MLFERVSFALLRERSMLTWHIVLRYMKVKRDILRHNLELVCWAKFRNDISQKYIVPENFNLKNFPEEHAPETP